MEQKDENLQNIIYDNIENNVEENDKLEVVSVEDVSVKLDTVEEELTVVSKNDSNELLFDNIQLEKIFVEEKKSKEKNTKRGKIIVIVAIIIFLFLGLLILIYPFNYIKLNGEEEVTVTYMEEYIDPGYEIKRDDEIIVNVSNPVDTSQLGEYKIIYEVVVDGEVVETHTRIVRVVDDVEPIITYSDSYAELIYNSDIDETNDDIYIKLFDIKVSDNYDTDIDLKVDYSEFDKTKEGKYTIYVSATDSNNNTVKEEFIINYHKIHVESITINKGKLVVYLNKSATLSVEVLPKDAYDKSVTWFSSDESIATVNSKGKITPIKEGVVNICVRANDTMTNNLTPQNLEVCSEVTVSSTPKNRFINYIINEQYYQRVNDNVYEWRFGSYGDSAFGVYKIDLKNHIYEEFSSGSYGASFLTEYDYKKNVITYVNEWSGYYMYIRWNLNTTEYVWESNIHTADYAREIVSGTMNDAYNTFYSYLRGAGITRKELINSK